MRNISTEQSDCKVISFMFICQFVVVCVGITLMTIISLAKIDIYYKILLYILTTLLTFKLEKSLFVWCMDSLCTKICQGRNYHDLSSNSLSSVNEAELPKINNKQATNELQEKLPYII